MYSQEEEVVLENPADVPVYVQLLPVALYPNPASFSEKLLDRYDLLSVITVVLGCGWVWLSFR